MSKSLIQSLWQDQFPVNASEGPHTGHSQVAPRQTFNPKEIAMLPSTLHNDTYDGAYAGATYGTIFNLKWLILFLLLILGFIFFFRVAPIVCPSHAVRVIVITIFKVVITVRARPFISLVPLFTLYTCDISFTSTTYEYTVVV